MGPFIKSNNSTSKTMLNILIVLTSVITFAFVKNGIIPYAKGYTNITGMLYPLIFIMIPTISTFIFEILYSYIIQKNRNIKKIINPIYSIFPGLFLGLILPINTPPILLVIGSLISSVISKLSLKVFRKNILNPSLVGQLFIIVICTLIMGKSIEYLNQYELHTTSLGTPLAHAKTIEGIGTYATLVKPYGSLLNFLFGTIPGALGETSALLCIIGFAYLTYTKSIKWRIPLTYILAVFAITYVIGGTNDQGIWYPLFHILSGGLIFKAVFMAADPETSPVTPIGQILYGIFLGILTIIFRFLTPIEEGVLISILIMNISVKLLDKIGALARFNFKIALVPFIIGWILILGLSVGISMNYKKQTPIENTEPKQVQTERYETKQKIQEYVPKPIEQLDNIEENNIKDEQAE